MEIYMSNLFNAVLMGVIVILVLMLVNVTGRAYYRELQRYKSPAQAADTKSLPLSIPISVGVGR